MVHQVPAVFFHEQRFRHVVAFNTGKPLLPQHLGEQPAVGLAGPGAGHAGLHLHLDQQPPDTGGDLPVRGALGVLRRLADHLHDSRVPIADERRQIVYLLTKGPVNFDKVPPERVVDYLALIGDSSDNIPGAPGIGPKTALKLIDEYGGIEGIIEHAADISGKRAREAIEQHADAVRLSKRLVTIMRDLPVDLDLDALQAEQHIMREQGSVAGALMHPVFLVNVEVLG